MFDLHNKDSERTQNRIARTCCVGIVLVCSFAVGCTSEHTVRTESEFQHLYSVTSSAASSTAGRSQPWKQWAVGIKEDWEFDIDGSDPEYLNHIKGKLSKYTVIAQTDRKLVLSRQFGGEAVTVTIESEPLATRSRRHIRVQVAASPD
jgi:hypothetical protein